MSSTSFFFYQSFSKFHIWIACIKLSLKFEYEFCPTKVNQDGQRNCHHLLVCTYRHSTLVIYYRIAAKFHIYITFINLSQKFEYGLCRITKMAAKWPPPVSLCIFFLTIPWQCFFCGSFLLLMNRVCHAILSSICCSLVVTCLERADLLALLFVGIYCVLSLPDGVSWVKCGT